MRTADLYTGPNLDLLPDILVEWDDRTSVGSGVLNPGPGAVIRATSARIGTVQAVNNYQRTGEHRVDGLLVAAGPGIAPGGEELRVSILDVAPTITAASLRAARLETNGISSTTAPDTSSTPTT